jgi:hypothetical protein
MFKRGRGVELRTSPQYVSRISRKCEELQRLTTLQEFTDHYTDTFRSTFCRNIFKKLFVIWVTNLHDFGRDTTSRTRMLVVQYITMSIIPLQFNLLPVLFELTLRISFYGRSFGQSTCQSSPVGFSLLLEKKTIATLILCHWTIKVFYGVEAFLLFPHTTVCLHAYSGTQAVIQYISKSVLQKNNM